MEEADQKIALLSKIFTNAGVNITTMDDGSVIYGGKDGSHGAGTTMEVRIDICFNGDDRCENGRWTIVENGKYDCRLLIFSRHERSQKL